MKQTAKDNIERALIFLPMALIFVGVAAVLRLYAINGWTWAGVSTLLPYALFMGMLIGVFPTVAGLATAIWRHNYRKPLLGPAVLATVAVWGVQYLIMMIVNRMPPALPDALYLMANILNVILFIELIAPHQSRLHFGDHAFKKTGLKG